MSNKKKITMKKPANPIIQHHCKTEHVKKYDSVIVIFVDSMAKDLKGWKLSNDEQKVVKSFRGMKTSHMHWHAKPWKLNRGKCYHSLWH